MSRRSRHAAWALLAAILALIALPGPTRAADKSGLDPSRLKLPKGPGSLEGLGENAEPSINMGTVSYSVPISLPAGQNGFGPSLKLAYHSGDGNSEVGLGWSLGLSTIERMTSFGLPSYTPNDRFAANGGEELVRLPGTSFYRARYEGGFVLYSWLKAPDGRDGYWKAEYPDGSVGYFGADSSGNSVSAARASAPGIGTFSYFLVERFDALGHRIRYDYTMDGSRPLLAAVSWAFTSGGVPRYVVQVGYESRADTVQGDQIFDGKPGFALPLTKRVNAISLLVHGAQASRHALQYEPYSATGGLTRLASVKSYGTDSTPYPVVFRFDYMAGIKNTAPYVRSMGSLGVSFGTGKADLIDINGDGLPDVVDTSTGAHRFFINQISNDGGTQSFKGPIASTKAGSGSADLSSNQVQLVDMNGDGFSDLVDGANKRILWNNGTGEWQDSGVLDNHLPAFNENANIRFFDFDYDKKPDIIFTGTDGTTSYYLNNGDGTFSTTAAISSPIGWSFSQSGLQMADLNGDGMQDAAIVLPGEVVYKGYLGRGRWGVQVEMFGLPSGWLSSEVKLVDLNGDGLSDAVVIRGNSVLYVLNQNGAKFGPVASISGSVAGGSIPEKLDMTAVRFADMNGNGTTDVVWIDMSGHVTFLDLFPERPNLLRRIANSVGKVTTITYGSSVLHMARDGGPSAWTNRLPHSMATLDALETYDTLSGVKQSQAFQYHNGYFDGAERQFRGYAQVEVVTTGDASIEAGRAGYSFDVGQVDRYRKGLLLAQSTQSNGVLLNDSQRVYGDCPLSEVPNTSPAIRFLCPTSTTQRAIEGRPAAEWITTASSTEHDGYGNVTKQSNLGITQIGGVDCGQACTGDESYVETSYVAPSATGRWLLHLPYLKRTYGVPGSSLVKTETTYYDGPAFQGLPAGQALNGLPTRVSRTSEKGPIDVARSQFDGDGNVVATLDANGHRRTFQYDADGLLLIDEEVWLDDQARSAPYSLVREVVYDTFDRVTEATSWMRRQGKRITSQRRSTLYGYDSFSRMAQLAEPGDTLAAPTKEFQFDLADPVSRIVMRERSIAGNNPDLASMTCFDGLGRTLQTRTRIDGGSWQASGFTLFNVQGKPRESFQTYTSANGSCDSAAPNRVLSELITFDAAGRVRTAKRPDSDIYGSASLAETYYLPLAVMAFDEEDNDPASLHTNTPTKTVMDGLGRTVRIERYLTATGSPAVTRYTYDELGRLASVIDAGGNERIFTYDLLDRLIRVDDPDAGSIARQYDAVGNLTVETDARGKTQRMTYDEANRLVAKWDDADKTGTLIAYEYDQASSCPDQGACANAEGLLASVRYPAGADYLGYDVRSRPVYSARTFSGIAFPFVIRSVFDNADRLASRSYPDGHVLGYHLDGAGRLVTVPNYVTAISYNARGLVDQMTLGNKTSTAYNYDSLMRLSSLFTQTGGAQPANIQAYRYTRDRVGNLLTVVDERISDGGATTDATYGYDAWYRLTTVALKPVAPSTTGEQLTFGYDAVDNIQSKLSNLGEASRDNVGSYTYGVGAGPHAVTRAGTSQYFYDPAGNVTLRSQQAMAWDYQGRLTNVAVGPHQLARYTYGPDRERIEKLEGDSQVYYVSDDFEIRDGVATMYVRAGGKRVAKIESAGLAAKVLSDLAPVGAPDGKINAADAWVANGILNGTIKGDKAAVSRVDALLQASIALMGLEGGERVTYLHEDALGTVTVWTDADGLVIDRAEPYPYGEPRYESGGYVENYWFAGQERDDLPGLSYHSARYLDTRTGRWLSADPLKLSDPSVALKNPFDQNVFGYVRNNPTNLLDPLGLEEQEQQNRSVWQTVSNAWEGFKDWVVGGVGLGDTMKRSAEQMQGALGHQAQMRQIEGMENFSTVDHERNELIKRKGDELVGDSLTLGRDAAISKGMSVGIGAVAGSLKKVGTAVSAGEAANRAEFELYKDSLRASMEKPHVTDSTLGRLINELYRPGAKVGSGSTAAAVRSEAATGQAVGGRLHAEKARNYIKAIERWLNKNPTASPGDRGAAENVLRDMQNALGGK